MINTDHKILYFFLSSYSEHLLFITLPECETQSAQNSVSGLCQIKRNQVYLQVSISQMALNFPIQHGHHRELKAELSVTQAHISSHKAMSFELTFFFLNQLAYDHLSPPSINGKCSLSNHMSTWGSSNRHSKNNSGKLSIFMLQQAPHIKMTLKTTSNVLVMIWRKGNSRLLLVGM